MTMNMERDFKDKWTNTTHRGTALNVLLIFTPLAACSMPSVDILMNTSLALCILKWENIQVCSSLTQ